MSIRESKNRIIQTATFILCIVVVVRESCCKPNKISKLQPSWPKTQSLPSNLAEDLVLTTPQLIRKQGYPAEIHDVQTKDGYILELHRIPHGVKADNITNKPVVFLQHCLLCSSSDWIMNTPDKALAYLLADAGYDVWLGNVRGNTYSRRHILLKPQDNLFWQFSYNEMGKYDAPAMIDFALNKTGEKQLYYIGFSMGTTLYFTMMHHNPQYNDKIKGMVALAPVAFTKYIKGPLSVMLPFSGWLETVFHITGVTEFLPSGPLMDYLATKFCSEIQSSAVICSNSLFLLTGPNPDQFNQEYLPVILSHTPAGTSLQTASHYLQMGRADKFQMYDYGFFGNYRRYGQASPLEYDLSRVRTPVAVFYSDSDWFSTPENVKRLTLQLPNIIGIKKAPKNWTHLDFVWALEAREHIYDDVLQVLKLF